MGYPNRAAIATLTATAGDDVYLSEADREGRFVFSNADLSAFVAVDTAQGIFVAPAATPSGVSGAWIRQYQHFWDVRWFGAIADDQSNGGTDNLSAINAMLSTAAAVGEARTNDPTFNGLIGCDFPGFYYCSALINLKTPMHLRGLATGMGGVVGGSRLRFPAGGAGIVVNRSDTTGYTPTAVAASTGSDGSILQGLSLQAGDGSRPSAGTTHGILLRARATIQECYVTGFAGTGIAIYADNGSNPMWGNASGFHIRGGRIQNCGVHGLHIKGSDTNGGDVTGLDTYGNG